MCGVAWLPHLRAGAVPGQRNKKEEVEQPNYLLTATAVAPCRLVALSKDVDSPYDPSPDLPASPLLALLSAHSSSHPLFIPHPPPIHRAARQVCTTTMEAWIKDSNERLRRKEESIDRLLQEMEAMGESAKRQREVMETLQEMARAFDMPLNASVLQRDFDIRSKAGTLLGQDLKEQKGDDDDGEMEARRGMSSGPWSMATYRHGNIQQRCGIGRIWPPTRPSGLSFPTPLSQTCTTWA